MPTEIKTKSKRQFLKKLAALQDEYNVSICSMLTECSKYSKVVYQIHDARKGKSYQKENMDTGRLHNSSYETRCMSKRY